MFGKYPGWILGAILLLVFLAISVAEYRATHTAYPQAWRVFFAHPTEETSFIIRIENDTAMQDFSYEVFGGEQEIGSGIWQILPGTSKDVDLRDIVQDGAELSGKVGIRVRDEQEGIREVFRIAEGGREK